MYYVYFLIDIPLIEKENRILLINFMEQHSCYSNKIKGVYVLIGSNSTKLLTCLQYENVNIPSKCINSNK